MAFTARMQAHLDRGTPEQFAGDIDGAAGPARDRRTSRPCTCAAPGRALLAAGDAGHARAVLRALLAGPAQAMPKDAEWLECHWAMADIAMQPGQPGGRGEAVRPRCAPYESLWAVDGIGGAVFGTVAEQLGRLAAYLGRPDEAGRYLATARERYERAGRARAASPG